MKTAIEIPETSAENGKAVRSSAVLAVLPPLAGELQWILGRPCFTVAAIGRKLHELKLYEVERKAEAEQAAAIHWMTNLYLQHGEGWREVGEKILKRESTANEKGQL